MSVRVKRIYEEPSVDDGYRVLVDRIWPRGMSKQRANLHLWLKDVAPSDELRTWFHHEAPKWAEFVRRYRAELSGNPAVDTLRDVLAGHDTVTLLYSARDEHQNQAVALCEYLTS